MKRSLTMLSCLLLAVLATSCTTLRHVDYPLHEATIPVPKNAKWWQETQAEINADVAATPDCEVLFVGDSITHWFKKMNWMKDPDCGMAVWKEYYAPRKAVNTGIMADKTQHVLWRLQHGNLKGLHPKVAVVMIGTNNNDHQETPEQTADGVQAIIEYLRAECPDTKVLLLGIFPRGKKIDDKKRLNNDEVNKILSGFEARYSFLTYLDIGDKFLKEDGSVNLDIMPDGLHPNAEGYKIWAEAMEPTLKQLLDQ
jgi:beta-glucosidase